MIRGAGAFSLDRALSTHTASEARRPRLAHS
jgi:hypothetical protein